MESTFFVIIETETKSLWNVQLYNKLKSRSNSSNRGEKQMFEEKIDIKVKL